MRVYTIFLIPRLSFFCRQEWYIEDLCIGKNGDPYSRFPNRVEHTRCWSQTVAKQQAPIEDSQNNEAWRWRCFPFELHYGQRQSSDHIHHGQKEWMFERYHTGSTHKTSKTNSTTGWLQLLRFRRKDSNGRRTNRLQDYFQTQRKVSFINVSYYIL